jgi:hypothetical protein
MKKGIIAMLLLLAGLSMNAQTLSNPNFESWAPVTGYYTDSLPLNWWSFNCNTVHPTTDAFQGSYAGRIQGWMSCGIAPGVMVNGSAPAGYGDVIQSGTPFMTKPASLSGFYKYVDVAAGDSAEVTVILKRWNSTLQKRDTVAYGSLTLAASTVYTTYTVNINDRMPGVSPDSIIIMFNSSKYNGFDPVTWTLPTLYIDRIAMPETPNGIAEIAGSLSSLVFPNPFSDEAIVSIDGQINGYCNPVLQVFDATGKEVMRTAVEGNKARVSRATLATGTYIYKVSNADGSLLSRGKFMIR